MVRGNTQFVTFLARFQFRRISSVEMDAMDNKNDDAESAISDVFPIPAAQRVKRCGMDFYTNTLGAPKYVVSVPDLVNPQ